MVKSNQENEFSFTRLEIRSKVSDILATFIEMYYILNIINKLREYKTKHKWFFLGCKKLFIRCINRTTVVHSFIYELIDFEIIEKPDK